LSAATAKIAVARSTSHQSQKHDNGKATKDDAKDTEEDFGKLIPNPAKTASYGMCVPYTTTGPCHLSFIIQHQQNESRLVQNQLQNQLVMQLEVTVF
jgi:hypothetical protein